MKNILILNGSKRFAQSTGELNDTMTTVAEQQLLELSHNVKVTNIDAGYDVEWFSTPDDLVYRIQISW